MSGVKTSAAVGTAIAAIVLGVAVLAWTDVTLAVVATLFGFHLTMLGMRQLAVASRGELATRQRALVGLLGGYLLVVGLICLFSPFTSLRLLAALTAIGWIADAVATLLSGQAAGTRPVAVASATVLVVGALVLLVWPIHSVVVLVRLGGWLLVGFGLVRFGSWAAVRRAA
ncbi:MAG: hypothetical protein JWP74_4092 [Marmoricola sp.]|nr:hypothetical protein [Marmoricola sp.]